MPRFILTGTPGSGKTALLRRLELDGFAVVEEAATAVIALQQACGIDEPWSRHGFLDQVLTLQLQREVAAPGVTFVDRSPVCTLALSRYAGLPDPPWLLGEAEKLLAGGRYERRVFFVRHLGFVEPTAARRISFEDALRFERVHEQTYRELGFTLVEVPAGPVAARAALVRAAVSGGGAARGARARP